MSTSTRTRKPADDEDAPTTSEQMAAEAVKPRKPRGAPDLWPFQALPRRIRAQFLVAFGKVQEGGERLTALQPPVATDSDDEPTDDDASVQTTDSGDGQRRTAATNIGDLAGVYEMMADLEDALRLAARDVDAFDRWVSTCSDTALQELSTWYMDRFDVGEA